MRSIALSLILFILIILPQTTHAQAKPIQVCTANEIQAKPADFQPGGIILTTFDSSAIWVFNIAQNNRYPLPDTVPCTRNCRTSPDGLWFARIAPEQGYAFYKMRFDGTQRTLLVNNAADVEWWNGNTLLVWTPDNKAYLLPENTDPAQIQPEYLNVKGAISVQPNGTYALTVHKSENNGFIRELENLELRGLTGIAGSAPVSLGADIPYFNGSAWSPDGQWLAFVQQTQNSDPSGIIGSEIYGIQPGNSQPVQWTNLADTYGAVRINGHTIGDLSWSPDSSKVAFWVIELSSSDHLSTTANAMIHIYDVNRGELRAYCGYSTSEHTPNPPRLVWSPDSSHLAFGGNIPNDDKGYLLLALNITDGSLTELSNGIFPALGVSDVIGWGQLP